MKRLTVLTIAAVLGVGFMIEPPRPPRVPNVAPPVQPPRTDFRPALLKRAEEHVAVAAKEIDAALRRHVESVNAFFEIAKQNTTAFARAALGWGSKWRLVADYVPFTSGGRHGTFLRDRFHEYVFSPDDLEKAITQAIKDFTSEMEAIENRMLVRIEADIRSLPVMALAGSAALPKFEAALQQALEQARARIAADAQADVASLVVSGIAGEVLAAVAVRLGVSAGVLGTGAATGWATFGIGLVVGLVVDQVIAWVWDWWADPEGELALALNAKLDELRDLLVDGHDGKPGLRQRLEQHARARAQLRHKAVVDAIHTFGENP